MKFVQTLITVLVVQLITVQGQTVNLNCNFLLLNDDTYVCRLSQITINDNQNANIVIGGTHVTGKNDNSVASIEIVNSNIPFIVPQLFTTFPNAYLFIVISGGLTRIQRNAFLNATNLRQISIHFEQRLSSIEENAFNGASNLNELDLGENRIENLHQASFNGLRALQRLFIDYNQIRQLHQATFSQLPLLKSIIMSRNQIESLDGRIFSNNPQITTIMISQNRINALGRNILDGLTRLKNFAAIQNVCVDNSWNLSLTAESIEIVILALEPCFSNAVVPPPEDHEPRRIVVELRGPLTLRFENGTEVVRV